MGVEQLSSAIDDYISARLEAKPDKWPSKGDWLDDAAKRAKQITLVTHAPKFTHGDARGIGARVEGQEGEGFLSTASLTTPAIDVIGNAAALDVANLLLLEADGKRLVDQIQDGDASSLAVFTKDKVQLETWCDGLSQALVGSTLTTHTLAKQTYFPVDEGYHLLSPLFASSLCHALYQRIEQARFGDEAKAAREARRKNECSDLSVVDFPQSGGTALWRHQAPECLPAEQQTLWSCLSAELPAAYMARPPDGAREPRALLETLRASSRGHSR